MLLAGSGPNVPAADEPSEQADAEQSAACRDREARTLLTSGQPRVPLRVPSDRECTDATRAEMHRLECARAARTCMADVSSAVRLIQLRRAALLAPRGLEHSLLQALSKFARPFLDAS